MLNCRKKEANDKNADDQSEKCKRHFFKRNLFLEEALEDQEESVPFFTDY